MQRRMIKKGAALLLLLTVFGGVIYVGVKTLEGFKLNQASFAEDLPITFKMSHEDSALIKSDYIKRIKVVQVRNSKVRSPISWLLFDGRYPLFIYKLDSTGSLSLKDSVVVRYVGADRTTGVTYNVLDENLFYKFHYKSGNVGSSSSVFLTIKGDSLRQTIKNDSLINLDILCHNMSIRYQDDAAIDIFIEGKQEGSGTLPIPMDILFCKRDKNIYLLILTANSADSPVPKNILKSILSL